MVFQEVFRVGWSRYQLFQVNSFVNQSCKYKIPGKSFAGLWNNLLPSSVETFHSAGGLDKMEERSWGRTGGVQGNEEVMTAVYLPPPHRHFRCHSEHRMSPIPTRIGGHSTWHHLYGPQRTSATQENMHNGHSSSHMGCRCIQSKSRNPEVHNVYKRAEEHKGILTSLTGTA